jgi:hypothetical protein
MKSKSRKLATWGFVIAAGWFLAVAHAKGETLNYAAQVQAQATKYNTPEDLIDKIPFLGEIPRSFLWGDGYTMKLSGTQLRIDHMGNHSNSKGNQRTCMVGLSYTTPVAFFTTRVDIPIFHSPTLALSDWSRDSFGDYVVYMSRLPADHASLTLSLTARF